MHPSLYPLVYGQSKILPTGTVSREDCLRRAGEGVIVPEPTKPKGENTWSTKFQWLPTEFSNDKETGEVRCVFSHHPDFEQLGCRLLIDRLKSIELH